MSEGSSYARLWLRAMRLHQWLKNLLILVPLLASHRLGEPIVLFEALIAFICFGMCASSAYILNDIVDLAHDRHHPTKSRRPFASGQLPVKAGVIVFPLLLIGALVGAYLFLPWRFSAALATYYTVTVIYSFWLKRHAVVDVVTLALLYTLRVAAGALVFNLVLTFWMAAFSMFIFLSLALAKRHAELFGARTTGVTDRARGRGYFPDDLEVISSLGAASGYLSVMVLALYIQDASTAALYRYPQLIWVACPILLYWISRIWLLTHRGEMHDDPVVFAIRDRASIIAGALFGLVFWLAS